jgi:hypothetical protein
MDVVFALVRLLSSRKGYKSTPKGNATGRARMVLVYREPLLAALEQSRKQNQKGKIEKHNRK